MTEFYYFSALANSVPLIWDDGALQFEWSPEEQAENARAELLNMRREYPGPAPRHMPPPGRLVTGSAWADVDHVLLAIYNHKERTVSIRARLCEDLLRKYGWQGGKPLRFTVLGQDGFPQKENDFQEKGLSSTGKLGPGELLLGVAGDS